MIQIKMNPLFLQNRLTLVILHYQQLVDNLDSVQLARFVADCEYSREGAVV